MNRADFSAVPSAGHRCVIDRAFILATSAPVARSQEGEDHVRRSREDPGRAGLPASGQALLRNIDRTSAVAGAPSTHVAEVLAEDGAERFVWRSTRSPPSREAVGLSAAGVRSAVVFKHNGLNIALDSLLNATVHSTGAAVLLVVGDDPDANGSTSVQDSRRLAETAGVPVLEPTLLGDADQVVESAVELSEQAGAPVLIRITPTLHRDCSARPDAAPASPIRVLPRSSAPRLDPDVAHNLTKFGRHQRPAWSTRR